MPATSVIGAQWGDEGKGKIIDLIADRADVVVRFQGGANAGHTVIVEGKKHVFHLLPSGVLHAGKLNVIGHGVVVDPAQLLAEIEEFRGNGIDLQGRLLVSGGAHVVLPYHKVIDRLQEGRKAGVVIGTTGRGIGPAYADKSLRSGLRVWDLVDEQRLRPRLSANVEDKNKRIVALGGEPLAFEEVWEQALEWGWKLAPLVADTGRLLRAALAEGKHVFFEGAQGVMLDIDHGTYPFVTSSNADSLGIAAGAGVPPRAIGRQLGVCKAYCTRVGEGPFPSELSGATADRLREGGSEFGATTGRPRRCGWLDVPAMRYAAALCGFDGLCITKLDVLSGLRHVGLVTAYEIDGRRVDEYPADTALVERARPVIEESPGWKENLSGVRRFGDLPPACRAFVEEICSRTGVPWEILSVGPSREATIFRGVGVTVRKNSHELDVPRDKLPRHVAIIMDGNGRWAQRQGLIRTSGHEAGARSIRTVTTECARLGLERLTLYAFSHENWRRPRAEVAFLMRLLKQFLVQERPTLIENDVRLTAIGRLDDLPASARRELDRTLELTAVHRGLNLCLALSYGGRAEIVDACRALARDVAAGRLAPDDIDERALSERLYQPGRDPDLLVRTAGEMRVSNFLLWQISYAELHVTPACWPEFGVAELHAALRSYATRTRKYGGLVDVLDPEALQRAGRTPQRPAAARRS